MKILKVLSAIIATFTLSISSVNAAPPCDFKGISVGDHFTPQQIMAHFGITKYKDADLPKSKDQFNAQLERAKVVGLMNAAEEEDWNEGPSCGKTHCRIPYGVTVGEEPFPVHVGVFVSFNLKGKITAIDINYDKSDWDEVLQMLNTKYGNDWRKDELVDVVTDYQTKKSETTTVTVLTHRNRGINQKTGDKCTINTTSQDIIFLHTTPPAYRAEMEIKLISKNF